MNDTEPPQLAVHPAEETTSASDSETSAFSPLPLGGWLWLPAIGLVLGVGKALLESLRSFRSLLEREHLARAASAPGLPHSRRSLELLLTASFEFVLFLALVWIGIRFAQRKRNAPKLMVAVYLFDLLCVAGLYAFGRSTMLTPSETVGAFLTAAIWVPYFLFSSRVRRTFLR